MSALSHLALFAAAALAPSDDPEWTVPAGLHLSSFETTLAARLDHTGAVDSGAAVLRLVDPDTGAPLPVSDLMYGPKVMAYPDLWATWTVPVEGVDASVRALAGAVSRDGDERLRVAVRVTLENAGEEAVEARVALQLSAGGGDPQRRPLLSTPFQPGTVFAQEGALISRDGEVVLAWEVPAAQVTVHAPPDAPGAPAATLVWAPRIPGRSAYYLDVMMAGPPATPVRQEEALRAGLTQVSYPELEERAHWQSDRRGSVAAMMGTAFKDLDKALCGSLHFLRSLGVANTRVRTLSDRPYGYPATDAAVPAEIVACFVEFGLAAFAEEFVAEQVESAGQIGAQLSPDRRVALAHALARSVRLGVDDALASGLAAAIPELVTGPAEVPHWADPDVVRRDLAAILLRGDPERGEALAAALPELSWASPAEGTVAAEMQAVRRALSAGDAVAAWNGMLLLLSGTNANGLGSMQVGGELDGGFAMGVLALMRDLMIDDHGADLHLLPAIGDELIYPQNPMHFPPLHSIWGTADLKMYRFKQNRMAYILTMPIRRDEPELLLVHLPAGKTVRKVMSEVGGVGRLMPDGSIATVIDPLYTIGVNIVVRLEDGTADTDEDEDEEHEPPEAGAQEDGGFR